VNNVLNHFDLVRGDNTCYRELYEAIDTARYYTKPSREEFIETMCEAYGCMTKSQAEAKRRLVGGGLMGQIESFLDTL
jgi:hypothetical protein